MKLLVFFAALTTLNAAPGNSKASRLVVAEAELMLSPDYEYGDLIMVPDVETEDDDIGSDYDSGYYVYDEYAEYQSEEAVLDFGMSEDDSGDSLEEIVQEIIAAEGQSRQVRKTTEITIVYEEKTKLDDLLVVLLLLTAGATLATVPMALMQMLSKEEEQLPQYEQVAAEEKQVQKK